MVSDNFPFHIIQGGMGVGASSSKLANTVSRLGQLGVVSGTAVTHSLVRRLQLGDEEVKASVERFPYQDLAAQTIDRYFIEGGKKPDTKFKNPGMPAPNNCDLYQALTVLGSFVEVDMAKQGHSNPVGINVLHKIQTPHMATLHGAMMAGVDYLLMGAGIPVDIPALLDSLEAHGPSEYMIQATKDSAEKQIPMSFDPNQILGEQQVELKRPGFFPIIASKVLAMKFARMADQIEGVIVEAYEAGGHNAPPRDKAKYGERDRVTPEELNKVGLPYFLAGMQGYHGSVPKALAVGARGVQVGSLFALAQESGFAHAYKTSLMEKILSEKLRAEHIDTNMRTSPTGFPFKEVLTEGSISDPVAYAYREDGGRVCDLGYLREHKLTESGELVSLCPSEPVDVYVRKRGGDPQEALAETVGRKCLCNHLMETAGIGQVRSNGRKELPIFTLGDGAIYAADVVETQKPDSLLYTAKDVISYLQGKSSE